MADAKKSDANGCLGCAGVMAVIGVVLVGIGVATEGTFPSYAFPVFGFAAAALLIHVVGGKKPLNQNLAKDLRAAGGRRLPSGWRWDDMTNDVAQMWGGEADMFDATHYLNVARGRSYGHDVALVTPAGGRSSGHYLIVKLTQKTSEFDMVTGTPLTRYPAPFDAHFFEQLLAETAPGRPAGVRNGCFWVAVDAYDGELGSLVQPLASLVNDYDQPADSSRPKPTSAPKPRAAGTLREQRAGAVAQAPEPMALPTAPTPQSWPAPTQAPPVVSSTPPLPGQPMALENVDAVDSSGVPVSGKPTVDSPRFDEPAEWTVQQWRPSTSWTPDTSWTPPTYTPTSWEAPAGSSVFGAPSSLNPEQDATPASSHEA